WCLKKNTSIKEAIFKGMEALQQYRSESSESEGEVIGTRTLRQYKVDTAPEPLTISSGQQPHQSLFLATGQKEIKHNLNYELLTQPAAGPLDSTGEFGRMQQIGSGTAEKQAVDEQMFRQQERQFRQKGRAADPSIGAEGRIVGKTEDGRMEKRQRKSKGKSGVLSGADTYQGPWAGFEGDTIGQISGPSAEERAAYEQTTKAATDTGSTFGKSSTDTESTVFHGAAERDYQGRTYMHVPAELRHDYERRSVVPQKLLKEWQAHKGGVSAIRFLPHSGHLLLSSGMDGLVKLFDAHSSLQLLRTFCGHAKAVRDITFIPDGSSFVSSSYDGAAKLWDTETGQCRQRLRPGGVPQVARVHPEDPNMVLVGLGDRRVVQWDPRSDQVVLEYKQHLGPINSLVFTDNNRRFVSSSDDKSLRVWEVGIPIAVQLVADPSMHSVPALALHPHGRWLVGQSMDNRIAVYSAGEKLRPHRRKEFRGHLTAGFACQPSFAPDGKILVSGDAEGKVWCWDWQTTRIEGSWKAHNKVTICAEWHPRESGRVATCSWDGSVKYWG
ncbi:hypothetical protein H4S08_002623, partial [Coemansia sp. RSA 1365]